MIRWGILGLLTLILFFCNNAGNYTIAKPLAFIVLIIAILFMTPLIYKKCYDDDNYFELFGLLILNSIPVIIASQTLIDVYQIPTAGLIRKNQYDAFFWAGKYFALAFGLYFAGIKIMNS